MNTEELKDHIFAEKCRRNFYYFAKNFWHVVDPTPFRENWHMKAVCSALQQTYKRSDVKRLVISIPPGFAKSLTASVLFNAWLWINNPSILFLSTSHSSDFSSRDSRKTRMLIKDDLFQKYFNIELSDDQDTKVNFSNKAKGARYTKAFSSITGARADYLLIDDPISAYNVLSAAAREEVKNIFLESIPSRLTKNGAIIIIAQRLHVEDIVGIIKDKKLPYEFVEIPNEYDGDKVINENLNIIDPRENKGELLFPDYVGPVRTEELKASLGMAYYAQYQQKPELVLDDYFNMCNLQKFKQLNPNKNYIYYLCTDHAITGTGDYNAGVVYAVDDLYNYYIVDYYHEKVKFEVAIDAFIDLCRKYNCFYWIAEDDPAYKTMKPIIDAKNNTATRIKPIKTQGGDKIVKNMAFASMVNQKKVFIPESGIYDLEQEMREFLHLKHSPDFVDAAGHIFRYENIFAGSIKAPSTINKTNDYLFRDSSSDLEGFY